MCKGNETITKSSNYPLGGTPWCPWVSLSSTPAHWYFKVTPNIQILGSLSAKERKLEQHVPKCPPRRHPRGTLGCQVPSTLEFQSYPQHKKKLRSLCAKEMKLEQKSSKMPPRRHPWVPLGVKYPRTLVLQSYPQHTKFGVPICKGKEVRTKSSKMLRRECHKAL